MLRSSTFEQHGIQPADLEPMHSLDSWDSLCRQFCIYICFTDNVIFVVLKKKFVKNFNDSFIHKFKHIDNALNESLAN